VIRRRPAPAGARPGPPHKESILIHFFPLEGRNRSDFLCAAFWPDVSTYMRTNHLISWLSDNRAKAYFGKSFALKADVLALALTGKGTLAEIARRRGVSRQAAHRQAVLARQVYGPSTSTAG